MLLYTLAGIFLFNGISAEAPLNAAYLPPAPPFEGYPPSRPPVDQPPQLGDPGAEEEDLESIVIDVPQFGRTAGRDSYGAPVLDIFNARFNNGPFPGSSQQISNTGASFTHFPGSARQYNDVHSYVYNRNQNNYARTNQHAPNSLQTSATFNNLPLYQTGSRSTPYQLFNKSTQLGTKASYTHLGSSTSAYRQSPAVQSYIKDQYNYQHDARNVALSSHNNQFDLPAYVSYSRQILNDQYLPPSRPLEQHSNEGYSYERPSIPFNF